MLATASEMIIAGIHQRIRFFGVGEAFVVCMNEGTRLFDPLGVLVQALV